MQILSLVDHVDRVLSLAQLHHDEWSHVSPFKTVAQHATKLRSRIGTNSVPATYILIIDDAVAGSVSLLDHDDIANVRPDLSPWLASLLVEPRRRGHGYGRALVDHCADRARALAFPSLYLYTGTHAKFYERLGWQVIQQCIARGVQVTVMGLQLTSSRSSL